MKCEYCSNDFDKHDLRPYGRNGAWICFDCAMTPENKKATESNFEAQLNAASAINNVVIIGEPTGPRPLNPKSLV